MRRFIYSSTFAHHFLAAMAITLAPKRTAIPDQNTFNGKKTTLQHRRACDGSDRMTDNVVMKKMMSQTSALQKDQ